MNYRRQHKKTVPAVRSHKITHTLTHRHMQTIILVSTKMVSLFYICLVSLCVLSAHALQLRKSFLKMQPVSPSLTSPLSAYAGSSSSSSASSSTKKYLGKGPVFVAGGGRGVGYEFVKQLSRGGTPVHALIRSADSYAALSSLPGVRVSVGDALDEVAVRRSMDGCVAAVTMLGGRSGDRRPDSEGNCNVIEQVT
jgi:hypothetical protein